jgi:hypothetical protein
MLNIRQINDLPRLSLSQEMSTLDLGMNSAWNSCLVERCGVSMEYRPTKYRLVIQKKGSVPDCYGYVIVRTDNPDWSEAGAATFPRLDAAVEAGFAVLARLETIYRPDDSEGRSS